MTFESRLSAPEPKYLALVLFSRQSVFGNMHRGGNPPEKKERKAAPFQKFPRFLGAAGPPFMSLCRARFGFCGGFVKTLSWGAGGLRWAWRTTSRPTAKPSASAATRRGARGGGGRRQRPASDGFPWFCSRFPPWFSSGFLDFPRVSPGIPWTFHGIFKFFRQVHQVRWKR